MAARTRTRALTATTKERIGRICPFPALSPEEEAWTCGAITNGNPPWIPSAAKQERPLPCHFIIIWPAPAPVIRQESESKCFSWVASPRPFVPLMLPQGRLCLSPAPPVQERILCSDPRPFPSSAFIPLGPRLSGLSEATRNLWGEEGWGPEQPSTCCQLPDEPR